MREDEITIEGVTLTTDEAREVLAFWDAHCVGEYPDCLWYYGTRRSVTWRVFGPSGPALDEVVDQLRDHVTPWTEVRRDEVEPEEVYEWFPEPDERIRAVAGSCTCAGRRGLRFRDWCDDFVIDVPEDATVLVRRPREAGTRLRDVEPGTRFRFATEVSAATTGVMHRTDCGWVDAEWVHWTPHDDILEDRLVRIVEGES